MSRRGMMQGTTQLTPGGRQAQQVFLSPANGDGGSYSANKSIYQLDFVLPDTDGFVSAEYGFRLRGKIKCSYGTGPAGGNSYEDVFLSPSCGLHGMIKSVVVTTGSNQVLERVQNYPRLATHLLNATSSSNAICSQRQAEAGMLGVLADPTKVTGKQTNDSLIYVNEINNLNERRFCFQLETGISKGQQDLGLRIHGGIRVQLELNNNALFLFAPNASTAITAEQSISNVNFEISDVTLEYTLVYMAPPANMDLSAPGNAVPSAALMRGMAPDGTQVYQSFSDSMTSINNSFNSTSFAPGLPAVNTVLFNFLSMGRTQGKTDPQSLDNFSLDRGQFMINGERVSYFDQISPIQLKMAGFEALGPWEIVAASTTIDQRVGIFGLPIDTYTSGPNMNSTNRPQIDFYLSDTSTSTPAYTGAPIATGSYKTAFTTPTEPAIMHVFFLGTRAVTPTADGFVRSAVL
ncbi:hypothetical protein PTSG_03886 [Salpingoeca rosetta]|uniref:Uncharacterized protein n=1 Tax=Salpingoeca rosetta (strain ATCC 50818 / BSB-021) TaxID=946362 RepID=F2U5P0_SALR5|nr:uncharacterized protein PTSG_03886 [Salpingoeca rosetta]EGD83256.1 hypothetical protein PTSG_03886 [Salpingoeca rosetta]|eukprot:XP_004995620.1 hypothetical protein PTSG_03886 [Salpingoeca rosetta]